MPTLTKLLIGSGLVSLAVAVQAIVFHEIDVHSPNLPAASPAGSDWTPANVADSEAAGDDVINALDRYRSDHGAYPPTLAALVPRYLSSVPLPSAGRGEWDYQPIGKDEFGLAFQDLVGNNRSMAGRQAHDWHRDALSNY